MRKRAFFCGAGALIIVGGFLVAAGLIIQLVVFPAILKHTVKKNLVLGLKKDGELNDFANDWLNSNFTVKMQYYIWNYTNAIEIVDRGMKPDAYQVGPYSYSQKNEYIYSSDSWKNDSNYFEYIEKSYYFFDPETSCAGCDPDKDYVRVPDPVFFTFMNILSPILGNLSQALSPLFGSPQAGDDILKFFSILFFGFKVDPIVTVKVSDLLFNGFKSPVIEMAETILKIAYPDDNITMFDKILFALNSNNGTINNTYYYTINTGKSNYKDVGKVVQMRNPDGTGLSNTMPRQWWNGTNSDACPSRDFAIKFRGTNGDFFAPFIKKTDVLSAYIEDVARSIDFKFYQKSKVKDIDTYQFTLDPSNFDYSNPENCGYCQQQSYNLFGLNLNVNSTPCLPKGILDIGGKETNGSNPLVHVMLSLPNFLDADDVILKWFPRAKPDPSEHLTTLDIEPTTGSVLRANKRLQISIAGGAVSETVFRIVPSGVYPIAWINNSYLADDKTIKNLKDDLITPKKIVRLVSYIVGVGFGSLLILIGVGALLIRRSSSKSKNKSSTPAATNDRHSPDIGSFRYTGEFGDSNLRKRTQN